MPGTDHPKRPRPKKVLFDDGSFSFIDATAEVQTGTHIFDYVGADNEYGEYEPTHNGEYDLEGGGSINVEDGVIQ